MLSSVWDLCAFLRLHGSSLQYSYRPVLQTVVGKLLRTAEIMDGQLLTIESSLLFTQYITPCSTLSAAATFAKKLSYEKMFYMLYSRSS